jgi:hypothetical protein
MVSKSEEDVWWSAGSAVKGERRLVDEVEEEGGAPPRATTLLPRRVDAALRWLRRGEVVVGVLGVLEVGADAAESC